MAMAEKTVPWWRRAIQFALGGIRTGFGLFQRGARPGELAAQDSARELEAADTATGEKNARIEDAGAGQGNAAKGARESESQTGVEDLAPEIPPPAGVSGETASNLPMTEASGEKAEGAGAETEAEEIQVAGIEQAGAEIGREAAANEESVEVPEELTSPVPAEERVVEAEATEEDHIQDEVDQLQTKVDQTQTKEDQTQEEAETEDLIKNEPRPDGPRGDEPIASEETAAQVETAATVVPNEVDEAAIEEQVDAIEESENNDWAEELETVETEVTVVAAETNEPADEVVESLTAVEVPSEEPVASSESQEPKIADAEEPSEYPSKAGEDEAEGEIEVDAEEVDEPVIAEGATAEAEETREDSGDDSMPVEAAAVAEAKSEEVVETPEEEVAEAAVASAVPEETAPEEQADPEPTSVEGTGTLVVAEAAAAMNEAGETVGQAGPEPVVEAVAEAAAAPAQLELIPKPPMDEKTAAKLVELQKRRKQAEEESPFSVMVGQVYEGPLDLLLDLIRKQDIDVYDIPIAKITAQFLAYVNQLKASDVDVAGEFIYTASLLIHIKSKMLLPRTAEGPGEAPEDPRRELVERLLEHERFKNAAQMLQQKQMMEAASWSNPGFREFKDDEGAEPEIAADTVDLVRVFREILERARNRPVLDVAEDTVTVGQMIQFLGRRLLMEDKPIALRKLLSQTRSERALIAMFLALLELVRLQAVLLRQDKAFSEIFIKKHAAFETVMDEGLAHARDDWR
jgi:segregation and condensation protein A